MNLLHFDRLLIALVLLIPATIIAGSAISLINIVIFGIQSLIVIFLLKKSHIFYSKAIVGLVLIYLYLLINLFLSIDFNTSFLRSLGFVRYIFLFIGINYLFSKNKENIIFRTWVVIIFIVVLDSYKEIITGNNILNFGGDPTLFGRRIVSFFKDEPVVGGYLNAFYLLCVGFLFMNYKNYSKFQKIGILSIPFLILICIILTGERANTIRAITGVLLFLILYKDFTIKAKLLFFLFLVIFFQILIMKSEYMQVRYGLTKWYDNQRIELFKNNNYFKVYNSSFQVFKKYPFFGAGNKNYRNEACKKENLIKGNFICTTHPHQIYFEFLSEHGMIGSLILLSILFFLIFKILKVLINSKERNYLQVGAFIYVALTFIPLLPSGAFFSDFSSNLFWINFSIMYASNKETNIFSK
jgi:O-antigen ligase